MRIAGPHIAPKPHRRRRAWAQRVIDELTGFLGIAAYLWACFGVLAIHEYLVLRQHQIQYVFYGFAITNALILGKVVVVAEKFHLGERFRSSPLICAILYKAFVFSLAFFCFEVIEHSVFGIVKGRGIVESLPRYGGGGLVGILSTGVITFVMLIPFFAFREIGRAIGEDELHALIFTRRAVKKTRRGRSRHDATEI